MRQLLMTCTLVALISNCCHAQNKVVDLLTSRGVKVAARQEVRLPIPTLPDGLDAASQRRLIEAVAEGKYSWEALTRHSAVAPFVLNVSQQAEGTQGVGRRVDVWFVAYGDLEKLKSDEFINGRLKQPAIDAKANNDNIVHVLTEAQLSERNLPVAKQPDDPRYVAVRFTLLEKVQLSATARNVKTATKDSLLIGSILDSNFARDAEFPNSWRPIVHDESGRRLLGEAQEYSGFGAYAKATRLVEPAGALLIEYHVAFSEPNGWFHGANLLRSKLPIIAQDAVRDFRRELEKPL